MTRQELGQSLNLIEELIPKSTRSAGDIRIPDDLLSR